MMNPVVQFPLNLNCPLIFTAKALSSPSAASLSWPAVCDLLLDAD